MTLEARIPALELPGVTPLYRDFISPGASPLHEWLGPFGNRDRLAGALGRTTGVDRALVASLRAANAALGVDAALCERLEGLATGSARAIVTGQQPGVAGGPLMTLYKAAAAAALARHIEAETGRACVPLFWLGCDDDDFAEVREVSLLATDGSRVDAALDASSYRPGLRVGDIDASAVRVLWKAVAPALPPGVARDRVDAALAPARDFGDAAARVLVAATAGKIAVIDGRDAALRAAGRDLLLAFFEREETLRGLLEAGGRELEARGYHAQVQWGADSGLFLVTDGIRARVPAERRAAAVAEFARDVTRVSPGVVARNLLQDATLAPAAVVLGPAEVAYRAQMGAVYRAMGVAMPVAFPRLGATYLPPAVRDLARDAGLDAASVARDPASVAALVMDRSVDDGLARAAAELQSAFDAATRLFLETASSRLDERAREKLRKRIEELSGRLAQTLSNAREHDVRGPRARWPFLPRMADMFRRDSIAQERFLSLVVPMLHHGDDAWPAVEAMAAQWARDALDGRVWHGVYSV
jgi:hypothetical protein